MTLQQVKETLPTEYAAPGLCVYMRLYDNFIPLENFIDMFGESELTYESLIKNNSTTPGWKNQFDAWHIQGII